MMTVRRIQRCVEGSVFAVVMLCIVRCQFSDDDFSSRWCPVVLRPNDTVQCTCSEILEIRCRDLQAVPEFVPDDRTYTAIYMGQQRVSKLLENSFRGLSVRKVVLSLNPVGDVFASKAFLGLETVLEELELGGCGIRHLSVDLIAGMMELQRLHLWRNRIEKIPVRFFRDAAKLVDLVLWGNLITEIGDDAFEGLRSIRRIDLDRNRISVLNRNAFRRLRTLEALYLGENSIVSLHADTFSHLSNLKVLNIDHNGMGYIYPRAFNGIDRLLSLSLNDNRISFLPDGIFSNLCNLTVLSLQGNQLENIWSRTFNGLWSLQTLNLSRNRLSSLPPGVFRQSTLLARLGLDENRLETIQRCVLSGETRLKSISLLGNPVSCECRLTWLSQESGLEYGAGGYSVWGSCRHQNSHQQSQQEVGAEGSTLKAIRALRNDVYYHDASCVTVLYDCQD